MGNARPIDDRPQNEVQVGPDKLEVVASFCYLGDRLLTWKKLTERDCCEWKLTTVDPQERSTWRSSVRSAMRAASQLPGKGSTDVDDVPAR